MTICPLRKVSTQMTALAADGLTMFAAERGLGLWVDVEEPAR